MESAIFSTGDGAWNPLIVCPDVDLKGTVESSLTDAGCPASLSLNYYPASSETAEFVEQQRADVLLLDVHTDADAALDLLALCSATTPVVALDRAADADMILRCLRRGAVDFLFPPFSPDKIQRLRSDLAARRHSDSQPKNCLVCCMLPGKVGSGASTVCLHLAVEMARNAAIRVLVVDLDSVTGSLGFLLKIRSEFHLGHALEDWGRMDDELWSRLVARSHGIDLLLAPGTAAPRDIDPGKLHDLIRFWRGRYDLVLLDSPGMPGTISVDVAAVADRVLLLTTDDLGALHATRRSLEILDLEGIHRESVDLLLNRDSAGSTLGRDSVRRALGHPVSATLPNDYGTIQAAVLDGHPVSRTSKFGRGITSLAGAISPKMVLPHTRRAPSLLRKLGLKK